MANGRKILDMIRASNLMDQDPILGLDPGEHYYRPVIEVNVTSQAGSLGWVSLYEVTEEEPIMFGGEDDELTFEGVNNVIEFTPEDDGNGPYEVSGMRMTGGGDVVYPEISFTPIVVGAESTIRFTEIKLTLQNPST